MMMQVYSQSMSLKTSSMLQPLSKLRSLSQISLIFKDHNYIVKQHDDSIIDNNLITSGGYCGFSMRDGTDSCEDTMLTNSCNDTMLTNSCRDTMLTRACSDSALTSNCGDTILTSNCGNAVLTSNCSDDMLPISVAGEQKEAEENVGTDFLQDLGELDFGLGDLDPCNDVEMEDCVQEFIDSALEKSSPVFNESFPCDDTHQTCQSEDISQKVNFLAALDLIPNQSNISPNVLRPLHFTSVTRGYHVWNSTSQHETVPYLIPQVSASEDASSIVAIPTKSCCCFGSNTVSNAVYSTAQLNPQDCVRICPSTQTANINTCGQCTTNKLILDRVMSPLFIDTSSNEYFQSVQDLSDERLRVSTEKYQCLNDDKDTIEIMDWLKETPLINQQLDSNNNLVNDGCEDKSSFAVSSSQIKCNDLDSFVDLDEFLNEAEDECAEYKNISETSGQQISHPSELRNKDSSCISQLNLSFLEELPDNLWNDEKRVSSSYLDFVSEGFSHESPNALSSISSQCSSPAWSTTDSAQCSPIGNLHFPLRPHSEDVFENNSLKSQLALLKLFSEENADSLLITDSIVPNSRFV